MVITIWFEFMGNSTEFPGQADFHSAMIHVQSGSMIVDLLQEIVSIGQEINAAIVRNNMHTVAKRIEDELGKSVTAEGSSKRFAFIQSYDEKPRRRVFEVFKCQGTQSNQQITFLSDGGDTVRNLQLYLNSNAQHIVDWFHIKMRLTVNLNHERLR